MCSLCKLQYFQTLLQKRNIMIFMLPSEYTLKPGINISSSSFYILSQLSQFLS